MSAEVPDHPGVRRSRRVLPAEACLVANDRHWPVQLLDLSLSGARLRRPTEWGAGGTALWLELTLDAGEPVRLAAQVVRERGDELALRFAELPARQAQRLESALERDGRLIQALEAAG